MRPSARASQPSYPIQLSGCTRQSGIWVKLQWSALGAILVFVIPALIRITHMLRKLDARPGQRHLRIEMHMPKNALELTIKAYAR
eukprot:6193974-Pleurochrysis_carterae.AAC.2